jgi:predicted histidine transporter YuiF (NhaC family)
VPGFAQYLLAGLIGRPNLPRGISSTINAFGGNADTAVPYQVLGARLVREANNAIVADAVSISINSLTGMAGLSPGSLVTGRTDTSKAGPNKT